MNVAALGLTTKQKTFRQRLIGGSDANTILSGDQGRIIKLWREKRGEIESENLDHILPVRMGQWTEPFNRTWFTEQTGREITHVGVERISLDFPIMGCTLDGLTDGGQCVFEAKHVNGFAKIEEVTAKYMPQLTHNMIVCERERAVLSVFVGNLKYFAVDVALDENYSAELIGAEHKFWECVETGEPPFPVEITPAIKVEAIRKADMRESNSWASAASIYIETNTAAANNAAAGKTLRELIEADVSEAFGHGIRAKRDKRGAIRITIEE